MNFRIQFYRDDGSQEPWWLPIRSNNVRTIDEANLVAFAIRDEHNEYYPEKKWGIILVELEDEDGFQTDAGGHSQVARQS